MYARAFPPGDTIAFSHFARRPLYGVEISRAGVSLRSENFLRCLIIFGLKTSPGRVYYHSLRFREKCFRERREETRGEQDSRDPPGPIFPACTRKR